MLFPAEIGVSNVVRRQCSQRRSYLSPFPAQLYEFELPTMIMEQPEEKVDGFASTKRLFPSEIGGSSHRK